MGLLRESRAYPFPLFNPYGLSLSFLLLDPSNLTRFSPVTLSLLLTLCRDFDPFFLPLSGKSYAPWNLIFLRFFLASSPIVLDPLITRAARRSWPAAFLLLGSIPDQCSVPFHYARNYAGNYDA